MTRLICSIAVLLLVVLPVSLTSYRDFDDSREEGRRLNAERNRYLRPISAEAREYCPRPPYMITTQTQNCYRVPTLEKPYCPFPN